VYRFALMLSKTYGDAEKIRSLIQDHMLETQRKRETQRERERDPKRDRETLR